MYGHAPMPEPTPKQRLAEVLLGDSLEHFVRSRRDATPPRSWRLIARDLYEATDVDLTHESLRLWFPDEPKVAAG